MAEIIKLERITSEGSAAAFGSTIFYILAAISIAFALFLSLYGVWTFSTYFYVAGIYVAIMANNAGTDKRYWQTKEYMFKYFKKSEEEK